MVCQIKLLRKDYRPHTLQDALHAKVKTKAQSAPITLVTETKTDTTASAVDLVAMVFLQSYMLPVEKSILDGSDVSVSSVHASLPLNGRHFIWTCQLTNTLDHVSLKAKALIASANSGLLQQCL